MNKFKKISVAAMMLLYGTVFSWAVQVNTDANATSWTSTSSTTQISAGDYLQLNGIKMTFGSSEDTNTKWDWNGGNGGMVPTQMPSTDGTSATLITSFSEKSPFGTVPTRGNYFVLEPSTNGTITINSKPSNDGAQNFVIATVDNQSQITEAKVIARSDSYSFNIEKGKKYYFFQLAKSGKIDTYRFTLKGISFIGTDATTLVGNYSVSHAEGNSDYTCSYFNIDNDAIAQALGLTTEELRSNYQKENNGTVKIATYDSESKLITTTNAGAGEFSGYWMSKDGNKCNWADADSRIFFVYDPDGRIGIGQMPTKETNKTLVKAGDVISFPILFNYGSKNAQINVTYHVTEAKGNTNFTLKAEDTNFYSLCLGFDATIPEGIEAYRGIIDETNSKVRLEKIEKTIPANQGVLVKAATPSDYVFKMTEEGVSVKSNDIKGVLEDTSTETLATTGKQVLEFGMKDGKVGFRQPSTDNTIKANHAYILIDNTQAAKVFSLDMGEVTAISTIKTENTSAESYNILGQRVNRNAKGLVICNGKKYLNK